MSVDTPMARALSILGGERVNDILAANGQAFLNSLLAAVMAALPDDQVDEFAAVVGEGNPDAISAFLKEQIPDLDTVLSEEASRFSGEVAAIIDGVAD